MRRRTRRSQVAALAGLLIGVAAFGQVATPKPEFEVAAIERVDPALGPHLVGLKVEHGRASIQGATLRQIIVQAYLVQRVRVLGGPSWYDSDQYNIEAKAESPDATREQVRAMLQTLLADRFKLSVHRETKEIASYTLSVAKNGPKLEEAKAGDASGVQGGKAGILFHNQPLITLVNTIANILDQPVQDQTGLKGRYSFQLDWSRDPDGPSLFTAIREQLGLELKSHKTPTEVLLVDHAERPSEN